MKTTLYALTSLLLGVALTGVGVPSEPSLLGSDNSSYTQGLSPRPPHCTIKVGPGYPRKAGETIKWIGGVKYLCNECVRVGTTWGCTDAIDPIKYDE